MSEPKTTFKDAPLSAANRQHVLDILKEEGFSEEQLNGMLLEQVWKLYLDSVRELFSREIGSAYNAFEKNPRMAAMLSPLMSQLIKELHKIVENLEKTAKESHEEKGSK